MGLLLRLSVKGESMRGMVGDSYRVGVFSEKWTVFLFSLVYNVEGEVMNEFNACFNTVCLAKIQTVTHNTQYKKPLHPRTLFVHACGDTSCHSLCPPVVTGHPIEFVQKIPCGAPQPLEFPQGDFLFSVSVFSISIKKNVNMKSHVTRGKRFSRCSWQWLLNVPQHLVNHKKVQLVNPKHSSAKYCWKTVYERFVRRKGLMNGNCRPAIMV